MGYRDGKNASQIPDIQDAWSTVYVSIQKASPERHIGINPFVVEKIQIRHVQKSEHSHLEIILKNGFDGEPYKSILRLIITNLNYRTSHLLQNLDLNTL
jgi:hypothetical protein